MLMGAHSMVEVVFPGSPVEMSTLRIRSAGVGEDWSRKDECK